MYFDEGRGGTLGAALGEDCWPADMRREEKKCSDEEVDPLGEVASKASACCCLKDCVNWMEVFVVL
jgi:hypothetical protein